MPCTYGLIKGNTLGLIPTQDKNGFPSFIVLLNGVKSVVLGVDTTESFVGIVLRKNRAIDQTLGWLPRRTFTLYQTESTK